MTQNI